MPGCALYHPDLYYLPLDHLQLPNVLSGINEVLIYLCYLDLHGVHLQLLLSISMTLYHNFTLKLCYLDLYLCRQVGHSPRTEDLK
jgi:hypothetical protein